MDSFKLEVWKSEFEDTYNKYRDNKNELKYQEDIIPYRFLEVLIENIRINNFEWLSEYIDITYIDRFIQDILNYKTPIYKSEEYFQDIRELEGLIEEELEDTHIFFNNERYYFNFLSKNILDSIKETLEDKILTDIGENYLILNIDTTEYVLELNNLINKYNK